MNQLFEAIYTIWIITALHKRCDFIMHDDVLIQRMQVDANEVTYKNEHQCKFILGADSQMPEQFFNWKNEKWDGKVVLGTLLQ